MGLINNVEYLANAYKKSAIINCLMYLKPVEITELLTLKCPSIAIILKVPFLSFYALVFWLPLT